MRKEGKIANGAGAVVLAGSIIAYKVSRPPELPPDVMGSMSGRIIDIDGVPITDRYVNIGGYISTSPTTATGNFRVEGMPAGYYYWLVVEGYEAYILAEELKAGRSKALGTIMLTPLVGPPPPTGALNVYITDRDTHSPIGGILVSMDGITRNTNSSGYCKFGNLAEGTYWMSVTDPLNRYEPNPSVVPEGIPIPETERFDIELVPLPPGPPPPPEEFTPIFIPLTCSPVDKSCIESLTEAVIPSAERSLIAKIANSYVAQYKPTALAEGPQHFYKWDDPEGGDTVHGYEMFGVEFEGRVSYPPTPQSGVKMIVPALEGKSWTCYLDVNGPYMFSSDWFVNCLTIIGSGSLIKFEGPTWRGAEGYQRLPTAGRITMLRIEFDNERWVVTYPIVFGIRGLAGGWGIPYGANFEWELADLLTENKLAHFKYDLCRSKLIELYDKYNYWWGNIPHVDWEDGEEAGMMLLGKPRGWRFWHDWYCTYTLAEVEAAYNSKISAADTEYAEMTALYDGLKAKYEGNWTDP